MIYKSYFVLFLIVWKGLHILCVRDQALIGYWSYQDIFLCSTIFIHMNASEIHDV